MAFVFAGLGPANSAEAISWTARGTPPIGVLLVAVSGKFYGLSLSVTGSCTTSTLSVYEYDLATDTATFLSTSPVFQESSYIAVLNCQIYLTGGLDCNGNFTNAVLSYDVATNTWKPHAGMNTFRFSHGVAALNGHLWVTGGASTVFLSSVEEYDPDSDTWVFRASLSGARFGHVSSAANGKLYAISGKRSAGVMLTSVEEYDPAANVWTIKAPIPIGRWGFASESLNDKIYVAAGGLCVSGGCPWGSTDLVDSYNPILDQWTSETRLPEPVTCMATSMGGRLYIVKSGGTIYEASIVTANEADALTLPIVLQANPSDPVAGENIQVTLMVTNPTLLDLTDLAASIALSDGADRVSLVSGPTPAWVPRVAAGGSSQVTWVFRVQRPGSLLFTATVRARYGSTCVTRVVQVGAQGQYPAPTTIQVYPNPFIPTNAIRGTLKFSGLAPGGRVRIFTTPGDIVWEGVATTDLLEWDGKSQSGKPVARGVYLWTVAWHDQRWRGVFVVE